jgi:hypothetical protein
VPGIAPAQQKLHPTDGVDHKSGGLLPLSEVFQEASDWPFTVEGPLCEAALLVLKRSSDLETNHLLILKQTHDQEVAE